MKNPRWNQLVIIKIVTLSLLMNLYLSANTMESQITSENTEKQVSKEQSNVEMKTTEVSMTSFGFMSVIILVGLSSLLGAYFLRDEFTKSVES